MSIRLGPISFIVLAIGLISSATARGGIGWEIDNLSADGRHLGFLDSDGKVYRLDITNQRVDEISLPTNLVVLGDYIACSPTGDDLAVPVRRNTNDLIASMCIYHVKDHSFELIRSEHEESRIFPSWSPDGQRLAYEIEGSGDGIAIYDLSHRLEARCCSSSVIPPLVWSRDSTKVDFMIFGSDRLMEVQGCTQYSTNDLHSVTEFLKASLGARRILGVGLMRTRYTDKDHPLLLFSSSEEAVIPYHGGDRGSLSSIAPVFHTAAPSPDQSMFAYAEHSRVGSSIMIYRCNRNIAFDLSLRMWLSLGPNGDANLLEKDDLPVWLNEEEILFRHDKKEIWVANVKTFESRKIWGE